MVSPSRGVSDVPCEYESVMWGIIRPMLEGLVQHDFPLTIQHILGRMRGLNRDSEVVTLTDDGSARATTARWRSGSTGCARALKALGVERGRPGRDVRLELAAATSSSTSPCRRMGAVLHTLNIRLFAEQLTYIANHAEDKVVLRRRVARAACSRRSRRQLRDRRAVRGHGRRRRRARCPNALRYEELLAEQPTGFDYPELDERQAAGLCYTSGTTGNPKGVLYSHRSNVLHALASAWPTRRRWASRSDRVLPIVPMFHANAWGLPYAAMLIGRRPGDAGPVPPGRAAGQADRGGEGDASPAAVPTIWLDLLRYADENEPDLSSCASVICGGVGRAARR